MRAWILTGTLAILLGGMLVVSELSIREERTAARAYERFCCAVEAAVDDACEYLSLLEIDGEGISDPGVEFIEGIFLDSLATALGKDASVFRETLSGMTAAFLLCDPEGNISVRSTRTGEPWKKKSGVKDRDELAGLIAETVGNAYKNPDSHSKGGFRLRDGRGKEVFLPDQTGLTEYKADTGMSVLVCMVCRLGSGLTGEKDFVCIRNAQLRRLSS